MCLNIFFQFLNNIVRIFIYFLTHVTKWKVCQSLCEIRSFKRVLIKDVEINNKKIVSIDNF